MHKIIKGIRNPRAAYRYLFEPSHDWHYRMMMKYLFWRYNHTNAYRKLMQYRIDRFGPEQAVGGFDLGIGELQFEFMRDQGLSPEHNLLDLGCGTLRGGEYFIKYLNMSNYTGMDISEQAIEEGLDRIGDDVIGNKNPVFIVNDDLKFEEINDIFDYAIAQSVFTHLPLENIDECLANIHKVVDGQFYATFFDEPKNFSKDFGYKPETLIELADSYGLSASLVSQEDFQHPRGQRMIRFDI